MINNKRIFEDHAMGHLQGLPVLIRDEAGLDQEAVDQPEDNRKHNKAQHTCAGNKNHCECSTCTYIQVITALVTQLSVLVAPLRRFLSSFEYS